MTVIETDKARGAETTPNHAVVKMLVVSTALAFAAMTLTAMLG